MHAFLKSACAACLCGEPSISALLTIATSTKHRKSLSKSGRQYKLVKLAHHVSAPTQKRSKGSASQDDDVTLQSASNSNVMQAKKSELKTKACQLMDLKEADVCMWDYYGKALYANMEEQLDEGVTGLGNALNDKQYVLLEEKVQSQHSCMHTVSIC